MRTLFILAGHTGAGKSTLLQRAFAERWALYGEQYRDAFLSINPAAVAETRDFDVALRLGTYFHGFHIPQLMACETLPDNVLLHIDLRSLLQFMCHWFEAARVNPECMPAPRTTESLLESAANDALLLQFFRHPIFARFDRTLVNTVYCEPARNQQQLIKREGAWAEGTELFASVHQELYQCWRRNVFSLAPEASFETVSSEGRFELLNSRA